jgi:hypothetical protein
MICPGLMMTVNVSSGGEQPQVIAFHPLQNRSSQPVLTQHQAVTTNFQNLTAVKDSQIPFFHNRLTCRSDSSLKPGGRRLEALAER